MENQAQLDARRGRRSSHYPELERWYAERAKSKKIEVAPGACHAVYISQPNRVAALIEEAAKS